MNEVLKKYCSLYRDWSQDEQNRWVAIQKRGKTRFIIEQGVCRWGLLSFLLFMLISHQSITVKADNPLLHILITAFVWLIISTVYGVLLWEGTTLSFCDSDKKRVGGRARL